MLPQSGIYSIVQSFYPYFYFLGIVGTVNISAHPISNKNLSTDRLYNKTLIFIYIPEYELTGYSKWCKAQEKSPG